MKGTAAYAGMVMAEFAQVGLMIASKAAISSGMPNLVFILYSNTLASLILLPSCLLFHRSPRPQLTFSLLSGFFLLALLGFFAQIFGYAGIQYSSATLGTAMLNLVPGFTFILAIIFRMERLDWRGSSIAKSMGTVVSIAGAFIVTFYKGSPILMTPSPSNFPDQLFLSQQSNWVFGGLLLAADCVMSSAWLILQASILKKYPAELIINFYYCFFVAIQSAAASLIMERGPGAWSLKPSTRFIAVMYSGVFGYVFQVGAITWCVHQKGPVFVAMFKPVGIVVAVAMGVIFLGDTFYMGSLIGATVIVIGFYSVMWGKAKEEKIDEDIGVRSLESTSQKAPLLQNYIEGPSLPKQN